MGQGLFKFRGSHQGLLQQNQDLLERLTDRYTGDQNTVSVIFDEKPEHLTRMKKKWLAKTINLEQKSLLLKAVQVQHRSHMKILRKRFRNFNYDPEKPVKVIQESESERNEYFLDCLTGDIMDREMFVAVIESGHYTGYTVSTIDSLKTPLSKPEIVRMMSFQKVAI